MSLFFREKLYASIEKNWSYSIVRENETLTERNDGKLSRKIEGII